MTKYYQDDFVEDAESRFCAGIGCDKTAEKGSEYCAYHECLDDHELSGLALVPRTDEGRFNGFGVDRVAVPWDAKRERNRRHAPDRWAHVVRKSVRHRERERKRLAIQREDEWATAEHVVVRRQLLHVVVRHLSQDAEPSLIRAASRAGTSYSIARRLVRQERPDVLDAVATLRRVRLHQQSKYGVLLDSCRSGGAASIAIPANVLPRKFQLEVGHVLRRHRLTMAWHWGVRVTDSMIEVRRGERRVFDDGTQWPDFGGAA